MKDLFNTKNLSISIVMPKARGVPKCLFCGITPKETEDMSISLPCVGQTIDHLFFHVFTLTLVVEKA